MNEELDRSRLHFLDNVRWIMIARVMVFHVAAGYSSLPEFFNETQAGGAIAMVRNIVHAFPGMTVLFFIAGYFALPSLKAKTYRGFIAAKIYVLGIPYLLCISLLGPLMPYLGYYSQSFNGLVTDSYWQFWSSLLISGFSIEITPVVFTTNQQFHPMHFWFLSVLLQFFLIFAVAHAAWTRWGPKATGSLVQVDMLVKGQSVATKTLLLASFFMVAFQYVFGLLELPSGLIFGILQFQPAGLGTYGGFFILGIFAYSQGWFLQLKPPGWWAFGIFSLFAAGLAVLGIWLFTVMRESIPGYVFGILYPVWMTIVGIWFLIVVLGLTYRYMNKPSSINGCLARVSYPVYLIHYPLILMFRLGLIDVDIPTVVKFLIVLFLASSASVFLGHYLLRPRPIVATMCLIGVHILVLTIGLPRSSWSHELLERRNELHAVVPEQRPHQISDTSEISGLGDRFLAAPSETHASWQNGRLYIALPVGLYAIGVDGTMDQLDRKIELGALAPRLGGGFFAIDRRTNSVVALDEDGRVETTLVDSTIHPGKLGHIASDIRGGLFVSALGDSGGIFYLASEAKTFVPVAKMSNPRGLALSADGRRIWVNATGDYTIWIFDVTGIGTLSNKRAFAELFRADGRYGRDELERSVDSLPEGMTVDHEGGLYVATRFGLQVFSPRGRLLGVINFPDVPIGWNRHRPFTCNFGGVNMSTLYVTYGRAVFSLETNVGS